MSNLPRTSDLPAAEEGFDPARVEEAFATFAERVQELEAVAAELREELHALRAERAAQPVPAPPPPAGLEEVWPAERDAETYSPDWVGAVPPPLARRLAVPRLALEGLFLLLTALFAGLADLSAEWIVVVMTVAWGLVALAEWAAAAERARWRLEEIPPPLEAGALDETGPWDLPVVEATVVDPGPDPESQTVVAKLPDPPEEEEAAADAEPDVEPELPAEEPARRRFGFRRRRAPEPAAADPWEA